MIRTPTIPNYTREGIDEYVRGHLPPGDFLRAVLENNLMEAMARADDTNRAALRAICDYVYSEIPHTCWGSLAKVEAWLASGRAHQHNQEQSDGSR